MFFICSVDNGNDDIDEDEHELKGNQETHENISQDENGEEHDADSEKVYL